MYINTLNKLFYSRTNDHITLQKGYLNVKTDNSNDQYVSQRFKTFLYYQLLFIYIIFFYRNTIILFWKKQAKIQNVIWNVTKTNPLKN